MKNSVKLYETLTSYPALRRITEIYVPQVTRGRLSEENINTGHVI